VVGAQSGRGFGLVRKVQVSAVSEGFLGPWIMDFLCFPTFLSFHTLQRQRNYVNSCEFMF
jgi:hypothetical protein